MTGLRRVTAALVDELIDFAPTAEAKRRGYASYQRDGAVALCNMLAANRVAYLADEVGMGKTYVALAVASLLRWQQPRARIVVLAPRENIQRKWEKELRNFVRLNWRHIGLRVKALDGEPAWQPMVCGSLEEFLHEALIDGDRDFLLRATSFSLPFEELDARRKLRWRLRKLAPWVDARRLAARTPGDFRDAYGMALNALVPEIDLLIVDEAHNLKHGFGPKVSTRNRLLGLALGRGAEELDLPDDYRPRVRRALLLSATPFEDDYGAVQRQLDVLGFGAAELLSGGSGTPRSVRELIDRERGEEEQREVLARLMLRRVAGLRIAGRKFTRNMYRREWRQGGLDRHDEPMRLSDPKQRLVVALVQKKVAEVLQHERFGNSFQIGMLSSFESFLESVGRMRRVGQTGGAEVDPDEGAVFDDAQQADDRSEREGVDRDAVGSVVESYRARFGEGLPHPKLDATRDALARCFEDGEKRLVFVRRVATVGELGARLDRACDSWLKDRMVDALPAAMQGELEELWQRYQAERRARVGVPAGDEAWSDLRDPDDDRQALFVDEDPGGRETFFSWFFRGEGPAGVLSGGAFQKNRFASQSSAYATFFEADHVGWLLREEGSAGEDIVAGLASQLRESRHATVVRLRDGAWRYYQHRTKVRDYRKILVFESYQAAGLELLAAEAPKRLAARAEIILRQRYVDVSEPAGKPPDGFPGPERSLGLATFFTELARDSELCAALWPDEMTAAAATDLEAFRWGFRRREQRRELLSAMARLGLAYVDLYLEAIAAVGSFALKTQPGAGADERLARAFVARLRQQQDRAGPSAWRELHDAARQFDLLLDVNFPEVPEADLRGVARIYGQTLQHQMPIGRMAGGVNKRLVRQFRMPGFPLVLVTTNVLQEGEDLHTFCRHVVHYGITWTPSAMEQRTGRVDRIGSLAQRTLDGRRDEPSGAELIQVQFPHLRDTVEVLQVRRVLRRLNRFLELMHEGRGGTVSQDSRLDTARALQEETQVLPQLQGEMRSLFEVEETWLAAGPGALGAPCIDAECVRGLAGLEVQLGRLAEELSRRRAVQWARDGRRYRRSGSAILDRGRLQVLRGEARGPQVQEGAGELPHRRFQVKLISRPGREEVLLRCEAAVEEFELDDERVDWLYRAQRVLGGVRLSIEPTAGRRRYLVRVGVDLLFGEATAQIDPLEGAVLRVVTAAAALGSRRELERGDAAMRAPDPDLLAMVDEVIEAQARGGCASWRHQAGEIVVALRDGRSQRVRLALVDEAVRLTSTVVDAEVVTRSLDHWRELTLRAWVRNGRKALVAFGFDEEDALIGGIEQPRATLDREQLESYVEAVALECDRFEFALTGRDRE